MQKVILASGSKNRQKLLKSLGIPFKIVVSDFDESKIKEKDFKLRAKKLAIAKAKKVAKNHKGIIIGCDTYTVCKNQLLEKPKDLNEAKKMIRILSGNQAVCYTGFCFLNTSKQTLFAKTAMTKITFRKIYKEEIEEYVKKFPVTSWAAAYALSHLYVFGFIKTISDSLTGLSHGLPTEYLIPLLYSVGYQIKPTMIK